MKKKNELKNLRVSKKNQKSIVICKKMSYNEIYINKINILREEKMKNKTLKIMSVLALIIMMVMCLSNVVMAADVDLLDPNISGTTSTTSTTVNTIVGKILGIIQVVAIGIAVIMMVVLAIKYISAAPAEKADIKKGLTIYIVGAVLLFGASGILQILKNFAGIFTANAS